MRIIVLADTHMPKRAKALPKEVTAALAGADHIIHAGDINAPEVLDMLAAYSPVTAVAGNIDPPVLQKKLGERHMLCLDGYRFGVCHGHGKGGTTLSRALAAFAKENVDVIIFGHSHIPHLEYRGGVLVMNPGSPTDKRQNASFSFGVIETGETLTARIVYF